MVAPSQTHHKVRRYFVVFGSFADFTVFEHYEPRAGPLNFRAGAADLETVRSPTRPATSRPPRHRSRFGYDQRFWGDAARPAGPRLSYWSRTRRPLPCLVFVLPILAVYELGVLWLGGDSAASLRTGADAWLRQALAAVGLTDQWLLPLGLILALLAWQATDPRDWKFDPAFLFGMAVESVVLAFALIGLSRLVDMGFAHLEGREILAAGVPSEGHPIAPLIGFLGAGVYEEALFRLALIPLMFAGLRLLHTPNVLAGTLAVTGSALLFSVAHHAGAPGEAFTWFAFIFRWMAGVYFAWVFVARGFGVVVGTHAAYDILVGWLGWHF
jgi:hypothetical protein